MGVSEYYPGASSRRFAEIALIDRAKKFASRLSGVALTCGEGRKGSKCEYGGKSEREAATRNQLNFRLH